MFATEGNRSCPPSLAGVVKDSREHGHEQEHVLTGLVLQKLVGRSQLLVLGQSGLHVPAEFDRQPLLGIGFYGNIRHEANPGLHTVRGTIQRYS